MKKLVKRLRERGHWLVALGFVLNLASSFASAGVAVNVTISSADPNAAEAGQDPATFTVTRDVVSTVALTVNIDITGTATRNSDYSTPGIFGGAPLAVSIPANMASAQFTFTPTLDNIVELDESILISLQPGTGYNVGTPSSVALSISDDVAEVNLTLVDGDMAELGLDPGSFMVTRSNNGNIGQAITVNIDITGTATRAVDYSDPGVFGGAPFAVSIPANQMSATVTFTPRVDNLVEDNETITVTLQPNAAVYTVGADTRADFNLTDDVAEVNLTLIDGEMAELGLDPGSFMVTRSNNGNIGQAITVNIDITGTATRAVDYSDPGVFGGAPFAVSIPANQMSATVTFTPRVDNLVEDNETITVTLQPNAAVYTVGADTRADFNLTDDVAEVNLTLIDGEMAELGLNPGSFMVTRSNNGNIGQAITVNIDITGTATRAVDYSDPGVFGGAPFAVSIPANELDVSIVLAPRADNPDDEGDETIDVTLQPGANYTVGTNTTAMLVIADLLDFVFADSFESLLAGKRCDLQQLATSDPGRFFDQGPTVLDISTDLMWVKCGLDGSFDDLTRSCWWADAQLFDDAVDKPLTSLNRGLLGDGAGYNDWRAPSPAELATLPVACSQSAVR